MSKCPNCGEVQKKWERQESGLIKMWCPNGHTWTNNAVPSMHPEEVLEMNNPEDLL